ncbi:hypothetical protein KHQ06_26885 [Nocardia tengchongensis]|uniref:Roadblock/LAMTOR2 domain-containing protein n=1 Tax=Nocardia tengchongensis TaxID=2055889 RepID=A0ABX8CKI7_9NOCA|nr:hypothetical protein [Nocardia tengchongensis]QVI19902.1 hypothetical protein KHQ06_26885 [Nocardia tengchongensis]
MTSPEVPEQLATLVSAKGIDVQFSGDVCLLSSAPAGRTTTLSGDEREQLLMECLASLTRSSSATAVLRGATTAFVAIPARRPFYLIGRRVTNDAGGSFPAFAARARQLIKVKVGALGEVTARLVDTGGSKRPELVVLP